MWSSSFSSGLFGGGFVLRYLVESPNGFAPEPKASSYERFLLVAARVLIFSCTVDFFTFLDAINEVNNGEYTYVYE